MWRALSSGSVLLLLAGCASAPRPQLHIIPKTPIVKVAPIATPAPTFKQRYRYFRGKLRWMH